MFFNFPWNREYSIPLHSIPFQIPGFIKTRENFGRSEDVEITTKKTATSLPTPKTDNVTPTTNMPLRGKGHVK